MKNKWKFCLCKVWCSLLRVYFIRHTLALSLTFSVILLLSCLRNSLTLKIVTWQNLICLSQIKNCIVARQSSYNKQFWETGVLKLSFTPARTDRAQGAVPLSCSFLSQNASNFDLNKRCCSFVVDKRAYSCCLCFKISCTRVISNAFKRKSVTSDHSSSPSWLAECVLFCFPAGIYAIQPGVG